MVSTKTCNEKLITVPLVAIILRQWFFSFLVKMEHSWLLKQREGWGTRQGSIALPLEKPVFFQAEKAKQFLKAVLGESRLPFQTKPLTLSSYL